MIVIYSCIQNENANTKKTFAALTANMKNVVREAAKAIQDTRNIEGIQAFVKARNAFKDIIVISWPKIKTRYIIIYVH